MFQLTKDELGLFVRSHFVTSRRNNLFSGQDGGTRHLPYVFTELNFNDSFISYEYIIMNGDLLEAKETYQSIYAKAANSIIIVDNYIDIQTLRLLGKTRPGTTVTIFSDNIRNYLSLRSFVERRRQSNYDDF